MGWVSKQCHRMQQGGDVLDALADHGTGRAKLGFGTSVTVQLVIQFVWSSAFFWYTFKVCTSPFPILESGKHK